MRLQSVAADDDVDICLQSESPSLGLNPEFYSTDALRLLVSRAFTLGGGCVRGIVFNKQFGLRGCLLISAVS